MGSDETVERTVLGLLKRLLTVHHFGGLLIRKLCQSPEKCPTTYLLGIRAYKVFELKHLKTLNS
jgi:hypothetical protein